jgi:exopolysaccharide production protein ExoQ
MPPNIAFLLCVCFIVWLFCRYTARRAGVSVALWIPLIWLFIVSSRPISLWVGIGHTDYTSDQLLDGSPLDSLVFLALIVAGSMVLVKRRVNWALLNERNRWLFIFFIYLGLSVLWSDYPFVALKRWIKDLGNVVMVLVVMSEPNPIQALRFLLLRCCYLLLPLSVVFIKYFPELGRYYDGWVGTAFYCGVTTDKNMLGMTLFACALSLIWMLLRPDRKSRNRNRNRLQSRVDFFVLLSMGGMTFWLLQQAHSATALSCTLLGALIMWGAGFARVRTHLGMYGAVSAVLLLVLQLTVNLSALGAQILGRDATLTGRTDIWTGLLKEGTNPLVGAGYYSFWLGDRIERLSQDFFYKLNEAHDTYLETYLNSGLIGLAFLFALILSAGIFIKKEAMKEEPFGAFRLACFLPMLVYGITEAFMNRLGFLWFLFLLVVMQYPQRADLKNMAVRRRAPGYEPVEPKLFA